MARTIMVCGHGPGISDAVAKKFSAEGFSVALVARNRERLQQAAARHPNAKAFPCDLADPAAVTKLVAEVRDQLGPIDVIHWNAAGMTGGDLATAPLADVTAALNVGVTSLVAALQAALPDLRTGKGAVLITGGGYSLYDPNVDAAAVQGKHMALAVTKAAQHKLAGVLAKRLAPEGIYVGEVVVLGLVKGTAFDDGQATLDASAIAAKFWEMYSRRSATTVNFTGKI